MQTPMTGMSMLAYLSDKSELIHPMLSHLPIGLLLGASLCFFVRFFPFSHKVKEVAHSTFWVNLGIGLFGMGMSLFTGDFAAETVRGNLCDVFAMQDHEDSAYLSIYWFSAVMLLAVLVDFSDLVKNQKVQRGLEIGLALLLIIATFSLIQTGHKGALLVYEQGAAVNPQAYECSFE